MKRCIVDRRDAAWTAQNADPDSTSVMKAPWFDQRRRLARRSLTLRFVPSLFGLARPPHASTHFVVRRPRPVSLPRIDSRKRRRAENRHVLSASHLDDEPVWSDELVAAREVRAPDEDTQPP